MIHFSFFLICCVLIENKLTNHKYLRTNILRRTMRTNKLRRYKNPHFDQKESPPETRNNPFLFLNSSSTRRTTKRAAPIPHHLLGRSSRFSKRPVKHSRANCGGHGRQRTPAGEHRRAERIPLWRRRRRGRGSEP